ncbi:MAG: DUF998 domain-containing protein [Actinomycetota bacterium]
MTRRVRAWAGIAGVVTFVTSWVIAGLLRDGYSPMHDAISRLAERGAPHRWIVVAGMVAFGLGALAFAGVLRRHASIAMTVAGISSFGVAVFPCSAGCPGPETVTDTGHILFAGVHYVALTLVPILQSRSVFARAVIGVAGTALSLHALGFGPNGALQRLGLTTLDLWLVISALTAFREPPDSSLGSKKDSGQGGRTPNAWIS